MKAYFYIVTKIHDIYNNAESIIGFSSAFILSVNVNWADKIAGFFFSVSAGLLSAYLVSLLKKRQEKKDNGDKKN